MSFSRAASPFVDINELSQPKSPGPWFLKSRPTSPMVPAVTSCSSSLALPADHKLGAALYRLAHAAPARAAARRFGLPSPAVAARAFYEVCHAVAPRLVALLDLAAPDRISRAVPGFCALSLPNCCGALGYALFGAGAVTAQALVDAEGRFLQLLRRYPGRYPGRILDLDLMFDCVDWPVVFPDWSFWGWYFIIIDDIWDTSAWDIIKCAFPENNHGSGVLTTTRIYSVAAACCSKSRGCVYKMKSLDDHDSRRMFFIRIFGSEDSCPTELEDVSIDILQKCGGLPLAIISISSLLADQPKPTFEYVRRSLGCMFDGNPTLCQMRQILELSFRNLPNHLKTCLLYLGMYPEDHKIDRVDLLRQWIAEGFVCAIPGLDVEDVAISYFNELINRSMVQPVYTGTNGEVLGCRVHDIMLDVIRSKIEEDNFISVLNEPEVLLGMHRNIRRASLQCSGEEYRVTSAMVNGSLSKVRSVYAFGGFSCQSLMLLKYVRVLHVDIGSRNNVLDLTGISRLFLLRYLKVVGRTRFELPSQIGELQQLETLDLGDSVSKLPSDIASLPLLLHLIVHEDTVFPDGIGRLRLVRTVRVFDFGKNSVENIGGLGEMTSLRDFAFRWSGEDLVEGARCMDVLRSSLERISGSLRILRMYLGGLGSGLLDGWSTFSPPPIHLRKMWMWGCMFSTIPKWFGHLRDLQTLSFKVRGAGLKDDGVAILAGLPSLVLLHLYSEKPLEERVHIPGGGMAFRALKVFWLGCEYPLSLTFEAGAMPMLKKLELWLSLSSCGSGGSVEGPLEGIEHLPAGLGEIDISVSGERDEDKDAVKTWLKIAFEEHHPGAALKIG